MNILFVTAYQFLPQTVGGLHLSTDQLCHHLIKRGHKASVLSGFRPNGAFALACKIQKKILGRKVSRDTVMGYPVWRAWYPWEEIEYVVEKEQPDVIVALSGQFVRMGLAAQQTNIPVILRIYDAKTEWHGGDFEDLGDIQCTACSRFVADKYRDAYGVDPEVIYPIISAEKCRTKTSKENITFINPHPYKGRNIAFEIARLCPDIPFSFVESWILKGDERRELSEMMPHHPNVTLYPPQKDMRKVYGKCKILLAPSIWEEAYGMVVTEAQTSGIPVIASRRGGLPEAVGPGGILLDPEGPIDDWVKAVRKLWEDDDYYSKLSAAALAYSQRPEMNPPDQVDEWERILTAACNNERKMDLRKAG